MSENPSDFERLIGHAALRLWSELPREVQEIMVVIVSALTDKTP